MKTLIRHATLIDSGTRRRASILIDGPRIDRIIEEGEPLPQGPFKEEIDAEKLLLLPGVIDDHVHFRDPGLTHKANMVTESEAAAAGGVTSYMDMPNTKPQTVTIDALREKFRSASTRSRVNYSFFFGATDDNIDVIPHLDATRVCGVKLFMGSSTGNLIVERDASLQQIFKLTPPDMILMTHCEDSHMIEQNARLIQTLYGQDPHVRYHPRIRSRKACLASTTVAIQLARETGARLHIAHISTAEELALLPPQPFTPEKRITAEACVPHLLFTDSSYGSLGTRIKCNPAIKKASDREALRQALREGRVDLIGTDHAPHLLEEKEGGCISAASGMPMVQFSLPVMLDLTREGVFTPEEVVNWMCHRPAELFRIVERGYIREGYYADLVLVDPDSPWTLTRPVIQSKCAWSPLEGSSFHHRVVRTFCNGITVFRNGCTSPAVAGKPLTFNRQPS